MTDIADYVDLVQERQEAVAEEPPASPWDGMNLPAIYRHLLGRGEDPVVAALIVDGIMIERIGANGDSRAT
jgi:hypothetical protein